MTTTSQEGSSSPQMLQSLIYKADDDGTRTLRVLDQLRLPKETVYVDIASVDEAFDVIQKMQIRGAPLIAIVAVMGLAVDLTSFEPAIEALDALGDEDDQAVLQHIIDKMDYLLTSRPTAVNLQNAMTELKERLKRVVTGSREALVREVADYAAFMYQRDRTDNRNIGANGAKVILDNLPRDKVHDKVTIMTICNTGSLATAGYGTALGVVRALHAADRLERIVALETRPYNQGSRLTAYEMVAERMPNATLICDGMAAAFLAQHDVDAVVVGADRVCANGDAANKIGTYALALCAAAHDVPFYVAAPFTTVDVDLPHGRAIPIEERPPAELLATSRAPDGVGVWNPAFDVTPARYITGVITERGVITRKDAADELDCAAFVREQRGS